MSKHTDGPWKVEDRYGFHKFGHEWAIVRMDQLENDDRWIAVVCIDSMDTIENRMTTVEQRDANARLIAAAPELLEALSRIIEDLPIKRDWLDPMAEKMAKVAIAKAKGRDAY